MDGTDKMETNQLVNEESDSLTPRSIETFKLKRKIFDSLKKHSTKRAKSSFNLVLNSKLESGLDINYENTNSTDKWISPLIGNILDTTNYKIPFVTDNPVPFSLQRSKYLLNQNNNLTALMLDSSNLPSLSTTVKNNNIDLLNPIPLSYETDTANRKYDQMDCGNHQFKLDIDDLCTHRDSNSATEASPSPTLKELLDLAVYLQESEANLQHVIAKYVHDENAAKEILQTISAHINLKIHNERQSYAYTKEVFLEQAEISKAKELSLQDSINVLVNINKSIKAEIDILQNENQKLKTSSNTVSKNNSEQDDIYENDTYLHDKLLTALKRFQILEQELQNVKKQNIYLESQLTEANEQIDNYKGLLDKTIADFEEKCAVLYKKLEANKQEIKECFEAGDLLSRDMESLASKLQTTSIGQDWSNLEWSGKNIIDLIHISRTCINDLGRELFILNEQVNMRNIEDTGRNSLKSDFGKELKDENDRTLNLTHDFASLKSQINNKESEVSKLETDLQHCLTENLNLKEQVDYMQLLLKSSDLYKELQGPINKSIYSQKNDQIENSVIVKKGYRKTEDKEVLCQLSDATSVNQQLKEKLAEKQVRVKQICAAKVMFEEDTSSNFQEYHQMLTAERIAMRELLKDNKHKTKQRNYLLSLNTEYLSQIENLKENLNKLQVLHQQVEDKYHNLESQYAELSNELEQARKTVDIEEVANKNKVSDYEMQISERENIIERFTCENEDMKNSIRYLQCTTKKLHNQLNALRSTEKEHNKKFAAASKSLLKCFRKLEQQEHLLQQSKADKTLLEDKMNAAKDKYNALLTEYNTFIKQSKQQEENLKNEIKIYQEENEKKIKDLQTVIKDSNAKQALFEEHTKKYKHLKEKLNEFETVSTTLFEKSTLLEESLQNQQQLEIKLSSIITEHSHCLDKADELSNIIKNLEQKIADVKNKKDKEFESCSNVVDNLITENQRKEKALKNTLDDAISKLKNLNLKYSTKTVNFKNLKDKYQHLVKSLNTAIYLAEKEKLLTRNIETTIRKIKQDVRDQSVEVKTINICVIQLTSAAVYVEQKVESFIARENELDEILSYTRRTCLEAKQECKNMRCNLELSKEKLKKFEEMPFHELNYIYKEMELKEELIKKTEEHLQTLHNRLAQIKEEVLRKNASILQFKAEISVQHQKIQILEFQKCELTLRLHETNCKLNTEKNLHLTLKESHRHLLESICKINMQHPRVQQARSLLSITNTENCTQYE